MTKDALHEVLRRAATDAEFRARLDEDFDVAIRNCALTDGEISDLQRGLGIRPLATVEAASVAASTLEASSLEASTLEASSLEASTLEASSLEASTLEASTLEASTLEASTVEASTLEAE